MASIKLKGDSSGEIILQAPSDAGNTTLELPATSSTLATQNALGVRNLIINGDMRIDQRNAGASVTPSGFTYTIDRWYFDASQGSKFAIQRNAGSVTPPSGFSNYLGATVSSSVSIGVSDYFMLVQTIEGFNSAHLDFGTANAKTVTLSFWVRSSLTGDFGGVVKNGAANRSYPFIYTINSANTWEKKSVTISGDTTGTWAVDNGAGLVVIFGLGVGSNLSATAGEWIAANRLSPTGATSVVGTSGATFYITGVQLEVGDTATPFEHRPYDMELARCQRYYEKIGDGVRSYIFLGSYFSATEIFGTLQFMPKRSTASVSLNTSGGSGNPLSFNVSNGQSGDCSGVASVNTVSRHSASLTLTSLVSRTTEEPAHISLRSERGYHFDISAEL